MTALQADFATAVEREVKASRKRLMKFLETVEAANSGWDWNFLQLRALLDDSTPPDQVQKVLDDLDADLPGDADAISRCLRDSKVGHALRNNARVEVDQCQEVGVVWSIIKTLQQTVDLIDFSRNIFFSDEDDEPIGLAFFNEVLMGFESHVAAAAKAHPMAASTSASGLGEEKWCVGTFYECCTALPESPTEFLGESLETLAV